jgi:serine protease Do
MKKCQMPLCNNLIASAIMVVMVWMAPLPARADSIINRSSLIRSLLPTVVNISVRKEEMATPETLGESAAALGPDATSGIKGYVGSGFVIDPSGLIVTNYHVVENAFEIIVTFSDNTRLPGKTLGASRLADLALVKVEAAHPLATAHWGDSNLLQVGDQVIAAGNPFGIGLSVSTGIVSGLNRDIQNSPYDELVQTDASINHGNSGGPLFNMHGDVVGVDSAIISPTTGSVGLGFAVPSNGARFVINQLRAYGWVHPGWIGVKVQTVTPEMAVAMGMARPEGSVIAWVLPGGPAEKAGLAIGDLILRYNGSSLSDERALLRDIARTSVGGTLILAVQHGGVDRNVPITVEAWPRALWDARDAPIQVRRPTITIPPDLGLSLSVVAAGDRERSGLEHGMNGVLVTSVAANSDSALRGIVSGDVILRVQDKPVGNPAEVQSEIDATRSLKRDFVLMLVLPGVPNSQGPKWVPLRLGGSGG